MSLSSLQRDERRCAGVYSQRTLSQLSVTAIITIWPEAISQGCLSLNLPHEQKYHIDAAYCSSPDLALQGGELTTRTQLVVTQPMKCEFLCDLIYCQDDARVWFFF